VHVKLDPLRKVAMTQPPESGRPCTALRSDGSPCRHKAINGLPEQLCSVHAGLTGKRRQARYRHGFYAQEDAEQLEYLRRVRPEAFVRQGGLALEEGQPLGIRDRDRDLHPVDPAMADLDVAIAGLLHKMEILDALIFRAKEHGLEIMTLLALYLGASSKLGRLIVERDQLSNEENHDLLALLERANAELDGLA
jgi:hypothetical protein